MAFKHRAMAAMLLGVAGRAAEDLAEPDSDTLRMLGGRRRIARLRGTYRSLLQKSESRPAAGTGVLFLHLRPRYNGFREKRYGPEVMGVVCGSSEMTRIL